MVWILKNRTNQHSPPMNTGIAPLSFHCTAVPAHLREANTHEPVPSPLPHSSHCTCSMVAKVPIVLPVTIRI